MVYTTHVVWWFWGWFIIVLTSLRGFDPSPCRISRLFLQMGWPQCFIKILFVNRALVDFPFPVATETHATWGIYIYMCMYICIYVYMHICIYVYMNLCIYVYMYMCIYVYMYICVYIYVYVYMYKKDWLKPPISLPCAAIESRSFHATPGTHSSTAWFEVETCIPGNGMKIFLSA